MVFELQIRRRSCSWFDRMYRQTTSRETSATQAARRSSTNCTCRHRSPSSNSHRLSQFGSHTEGICAKPPLFNQRITCNLCSNGPHSYYCRGRHSYTLNKFSTGSLCKRSQDQLLQLYKGPSRSSESSKKVIRNLRPPMYSFKTSSIFWRPLLREWCSVLPTRA